MKDYRLAKIAMYGELASGHRNSGAPKKQYKDALKKNMSACHNRPSEWSALAVDRSAWRHTIKRAAETFEEICRTSIQAKKQRRKDRAAMKPTPNETFSCRHCKRACLSRIGLISHERACRRRGQPS